MGPAFVSACFVGKIDANKELQITLHDQGPLADNAAKGLCFHLLELTQRGVIGGRNPNKTAPVIAMHAFLSTVADFYSKHNLRWRVSKTLRMSSDSYRIIFENTICLQTVLLDLTC